MEGKFHDVCNEKSVAETAIKKATKNDLTIKELSDELGIDGNIRELSNCHNIYLGSTFKSSPYSLFIEILSHFPNQYLHVYASMILTGTGIFLAFQKELQSKNKSKLRIYILGISVSRGLGNVWL